MRSYKLISIIPIYFFALIDVKHRSTQIITSK